MTIPRWYSQWTRGWQLLLWTSRTIQTRPSLYWQTLNTYNIITKDPTGKLKNKLAQTLRDITNQRGHSYHSYRKVYPTSAVPPKFYGLPKMHKVDTPLRPIVSSSGSITYGVAKKLANIICPLVGQSPHHLKIPNISCNISKR